MEIKTETSADKIIPEPYTELESQFIMRLPLEPARKLREALRSGNFLKDRLSIRLENDMRKGEVQFDHFSMYSRVIDLPCVIESLKTLDNKNTYKTADICQMLLCKEDEDPILSDEEDRTKMKKKDPLKVDKKYLWPHGVTPPMKNVRRRRFRKTLRKKYAEAPEIEKEVKRLLRGDSDAVSVRWEVSYEQEEKPKARNVAAAKREQIKNETDLVLDEDSQFNIDVAEHDIFGEALSDSDDENTNLDDENSRMSAEDSRSRLSDNISLPGQSSSGLVTEFSREMFSSDSSIFKMDNNSVKSELINYDIPDESSMDEFLVKSDSVNYNYRLYGSEEVATDEIADDDNDYNTDRMSPENIRMRMDVLQTELTDLRARIHQQELEIANIENHALRQRFQNTLDALLTEQIEKEQEYQELASVIGG